MVDNILFSMAAAFNRVAVAVAGDKTPKAKPNSRPGTQVWAPHGLPCNPTVLVTTNCMCNALPARQTAPIASDSRTGTQGSAASDGDRSTGRAAGDRSRRRGKAAGKKPAAAHLPATVESSIPEPKVEKAKLAKRRMRRLSVGVMVGNGGAGASGGGGEETPGAAESPDSRPSSRPSGAGSAAGSRPSSEDDGVPFTDLPTGPFTAQSTDLSLTHPLTSH